MSAVTKLVNNVVPSIWRVRLGTDPPAKVRAMGIRLMPGSRVQNCGGRRYAESQRSFMHEEVGEMLRLGLVRRVTAPSSWTSPVVLARKPDGSWRMCVDLRAVNAVTESLPFPMPRLEELTQHLSGSKFFAKFDMLKGYWQVPLEEEAKKYFTFATHEGLYEPERVPMGAKNAVAHFQSVEILTDLLYRVVIVYLDDICVHASTEEGLACYSGLKVYFGAWMKSESSCIQTSECYSRRRYCGVGEWFLEMASR